MKLSEDILEKLYNINGASIKVALTLLSMSVEGSLKKTLSTREIVENMQSRIEMSDQYARQTLGTFISIGGAGFLKRINHGTFLVSDTLLGDSAMLAREIGSVVRIIGEQANPDHAESLCRMAFNTVGDNEILDIFANGCLGDKRIAMFLEKNILKRSSKYKFMINPEVLFVGNYADYQRFNNLYKMI